MHRVGMPVPGGQVQRCVLLCIAGINLSALSQQPADLRRIACCGCIVQGGGGTSRLAASATGRVPAESRNDGGKEEGGCTF